MPNVEGNAAVADEVPWAEHITEYDERHFVVYLRLLDASAEGSTDEEMSRLVLGIDPFKEGDRARRALDCHLRRARWMTEHGYRDLLSR